MILADLQTMTFQPGAFPRLELTPAVPAPTMLANMRSALTRGLPELRLCRPHGHVLNVAAGGPSLADTAEHLSGYITTVNGSLRYLLERGIVPHACGVLDPGEHIADLLSADRRVRYYVASLCHPSVFDKLKDCHVTLWHPSGMPGSEDMVRDLRPDTWLQIGGGSTMGVRWLSLGYALGFRSFAFHGLDSSFREGATHAYPDRADSKCTISVNGYETRINFLAQVSDFLAILHRHQMPDVDPIKVDVLGDGLLQSVWRELNFNAPAEVRETSKYEGMWRHANYRDTSPAERHMDEINSALGAKPGATMVDFGCGPGRAAARMQAAGYRVTGVDIAHNCLDERVSVPLVVAPLWRLPADLAAETGWCCDVMEHIPPDRVEAVLAEIARVVTGRVWFRIALDPCAWGTAVGMPLHLTVQPHDWWLERLEQFWSVIQSDAPGQFTVEARRIQA